MTARLPDQAVVLAAGEGRRLLPFTARRPKPLLTHLNLPLLQHVVARLAARGVRRVAVNAFHLAEQLRVCVESSPWDDVEVHVETEPRLLGTAGGLRNLLAWMAGRPTWVLTSDVLADFDLAALASRHRQSRAAATMAVVEGPSVDAFGAVERDAHDHIVDIVHALGRPGRAAVNASCHLLEPEFVARLPEGRGCLVRDGYLPALREGLRCTAHVHRGSWFEVGTAAGLLAAQHAALAGSCPPPPPGLLARAGRGRPVASLVHATAQVHDEAQLDHTTVGAGASVGRGARLARCLVLPGAHVEPGARLADVIVERADSDVPPAPARALGARGA